MYSAEVLDHFEHPRNPGDVAGADASVQVENPACGDVLKLSARVGEGRLVEVRFRAKGCVPAIACGSLLTEMVRGQTLAEARAVSRDDLLKAIGGLPAASGHAAHLALDALKAMLQELQSTGKVK
ncbi:MAG TPA: iron-sulfur cluster assembly scaffold protein [Terriglobales bacterium]|nr:iron-sulfur cluster assembly scaffold protein [Terriglobales bacterium]